MAGCVGHAKCSGRIGTAFLADFEGSGVQKVINEMRMNAPTLPMLDGFNVGPCSITSATGSTAVVPCTDPRFLHADQPFEGRDIIYVHGLGMGHLMDRIAHPASPGSTSVHPSHARWPADTPEYLNANGYFRNYAKDYWSNHIRENLFDPNAPANPNAGWQFTRTRDPGTTRRRTGTCWSRGRRIRRSSTLSTR